MMEGVDRGVSAVCFVGYHGMAGTENAAIAHIFHGRISALTFNGLKVGEIGLNALIAGCYNVPVIMISGDRVACREASGLIPGIETAEVKESIGAYAGVCIHPVKSREKIYQAVRKALSNKKHPLPLVLGNGPVTMEVGFTTASGADRALRLPGTRRLTGDTITYTAKDFLTAFQAFSAVADLMELVPFI
jgi:D-amino peptidase